MSMRERRMQDLRRTVPQLDPVAARERLDQGALLLDVREPDEIAQGTPLGAQPLSRGFLELRIERLAPDLDQPIMLLCESGARSLFAAASLQQLGYRQVYNVSGGFQRWKAEGLPCAVPRSLNAEARQRYARQLNLPEVGEQGQQRLQDSRVLIVGAGGLGSPAALYLAAAGVGTLGIVDHDRVDRSNLQRQILHADSRVGMSKANSAEVALKALNPSVEVCTHELRVDATNADALVHDYDLVLDGSDNFRTRYVLNDACLRHGLPLVHGSIYRFEGQVAAFWPQREGPCYRCLFPEPPPPELAPSCDEAGVLGVLPGTIGLLQATEALKLLLDIGEPLLGRMVIYNALSSEMRRLRIAARMGCSCRTRSVEPIEALQGDAAL